MSKKRQTCFPNCINAILKNPSTEQKRKYLPEYPGVQTIFDGTKDEIFVAELNSSSQDKINAGKTAASYIKSVLSPYIPKSVLDSASDTDYYSVKEYEENGIKYIKYLPNIPEVVGDFIDNEIQLFDPLFDPQKQAPMGVVRARHSGSNNNSNTSAVEAAFEYSRTHIGYDEKRGDYSLKGVDGRIIAPISERVTNYVNRNHNIVEDDMTAPLMYGTVIDNIVRKILRGETSFGNDELVFMDSDRRESIEKFCNDVKEAINKRFPEYQAIYTNEEDLRILGQIYYNEWFDQSIAGTIDIMVKDKNGKYHIIDIKTYKCSRNDDAGEARFEKKVRGVYTDQLTFYQRLYEVNGVHIESINILPIRLDYTVNDVNSVPQIMNTLKYDGNQMQVYDVEQLNPSDVHLPKTIKKFDPYDERLTTHSSTGNMIAAENNMTKIFYIYRNYLEEVKAGIEENYRHYRKTHSGLKQTEKYIKDVADYEEKIRTLEDSLKNSKRKDWHFVQSLELQIAEIKKTIENGVDDQIFDEYLLDLRLSILGEMIGLSVKDAEDKEMADRLTNCQSEISTLKNDLSLKRLQYIEATLEKTGPFSIKVLEEEISKNSGDSEEERRKRKEAEDKIKKIKRLFYREMFAGGIGMGVSNFIYGARSGHGLIGQLLAYLKEQYLVQERGIDAEARQRLKAAVEKFTKGSAKGKFDWLYAVDENGEKTGFLVSRYKPKVYTETIPNAKRNIKKFYEMAESQQTDVDNKIVKEFMRILFYDIDFSPLLSNKKFLDAISAIFGENDENVKELIAGYNSSHDTYGIEDNFLDDAIKNMIVYKQKYGNSDILSKIIILSKMTDLNDFQQLREQLPVGKFEGAEYIPIIPKNSVENLSEEYSQNIMKDDLKKEIYICIQQLLHSINGSYGNSEEILTQFLKDCYMKIENGKIDFKSNKRLKNILSKLRKTFSNSTFVNQVGTVQKKDGSVNISSLKDQMTDSLRHKSIKEIVAIIRKNSNMPDYSFTEYLQEVYSEKNVEIISNSGDGHTTYKIEGTLQSEEGRAKDRVKYKNRLIQKYISSIIYQFMDTSDPIEDVLYAAEAAADYRARMYVSNMANQMIKLFGDLSLQEENEGKKKLYIELKGNIEEYEKNPEKFELDSTQAKKISNWLDQYTTLNINGNKNALNDKQYTGNEKRAYRTNTQRYMQELYDETLEHFKDKETFEKFLKGEGFSSDILDFEVEEEDEKTEKITRYIYSAFVRNSQVVYRKTYKEGKGYKIVDVEFEEFQKEIERVYNERKSELFSPVTFLASLDAAGGIIAQTLLSLALKSGLKNRFEGLTKNLITSQGNYGYDTKDLAEARKLLKNVNLFRKEYPIRKHARDIAYILNYASLKNFGLTIKEGQFLRTYLTFIDAVDIFQSHTSEARSTDTIIFKKGLSELLTNWATNDPEAKNQGEIITALLMNSDKIGVTVKDKNGKEHNLIENGEFTIYDQSNGKKLTLKPEFDTDLNRELWIQFKHIEGEKDATMLLNGIQMVIQNVHGNYNTGDRAIYKGKTVPTLLGLFKTYLAEHIYQEYKNEGYNIATGKFNVRGRKTELAAHPASALFYVLTSSAFTFNWSDYPIWDMAKKEFYGGSFGSAINNIGKAFVAHKGEFITLGVNSTLLMFAFKFIRNRLKNMDDALEEEMKTTFLQGANMLLGDIVETTARTIETPFYLLSEFLGHPWLLKPLHNMPISRSVLKKRIELAEKHGRMTAQQRRALSENWQQLALQINIKYFTKLLLSLYDLLILSLQNSAGSEPDDYTEDQIRKRQKRIEATINLIKAHQNWISNTARNMTSDMIKYTHFFGIYNDITSITAVSILFRMSQFWHKDKSKMDGMEMGKAFFKAHPLPPTKQGWAAIVSGSLGLAEYHEPLAAFIEATNPLLGDEKVYNEQNVPTFGSSWDLRTTQGDEVFYKKLCDKVRKDVVKEATDSVKTKMAGMEPYLHHMHKDEKIEEDFEEKGYLDKIRRQTYKQKGSKDEPAETYEQTLARITQKGYASTIADVVLNNAGNKSDTETKKSNKHGTKKTYTKHTVKKNYKK